jgi:NADH dehydrogenase (ubiquinone) Fe-S protein 7
MKAITGKPHREVPLPSQEGKQGVMQYALYVLEDEKDFGRHVRVLT